MLPSSFVKEIGLSTKDEGKLVDMNDGGNKSFSQIAAYIERRKTL